MLPTAHQRLSPASSAAETTPPPLPPSLATNVLEHTNHITVSDILERYGNDIDLLKRILDAKAKEDTRKAAEALKQIEQMKLEEKYIDWVIVNTGDASTVFDHSDSRCNHELPKLLSDGQSTPQPTITCHVQDYMTTPPATMSITSSSPHTSHTSLIPPSSPSPDALLADVQLGDLTISSPDHDATLNKAGMCKRTLSRTRSQRRPPMEQNKKYRSLPLTMPAPLPEHVKSEEDEPLDHGKVMEALRAKLRRSSNPNAYSNTPVPPRHASLPSSSPSSSPPPPPPPPHHRTMHASHRNSHSPVNTKHSTLQPCE